MVALSDVRRWDANELEQVRDAYKRALDVLTGEGEEFRRLRITETDWTGEASQRAMRAHDVLVRQGDGHAAGAAAIVKALEQTADAIPPLHRLLDEAHELGRKYGYTVGENGELTDDFAGRAPPAELHPDDRQRAKQEVEAKLGQVLRTATDVDRDLAAVYAKIDRGGFGDDHAESLSTAAASGAQAAGLAPPRPPKNGTPAQNAAWWQSLSKDEQQGIIEKSPDEIGNLNGVAAWARSAANMNRIRGMRRRLLDQAAHGDFDEAEDKLKSLDKVLDTMHQRDGVHRQLLVLDDHDKRLEAAVAVGDVDKADNVAVFTPGFTTTVQDSLTDYDRSMRELKKVSDNTSTTYGDRKKTACVTWIGYQAPQTSEVLNPTRSVAGSLDAIKGGRDLNQFYNGVEEARRSSGGASPHMTAIGHSYGSATTGAALGAKNTPVDDAVMIGSPGQVSPRLNVPRGHLYSEWDKDDYVPYTNMGGTLGPNVYDHSRVLSTDESQGGQLEESTGHSATTGYLANKTTSQHNIAAIVAGHPKLAKSVTGWQFLNDRLGAP